MCFRYNLGFCLAGTRHFQEALTAYDACATMRLGLFGELHDSTIATLNNVAFTQQQLGNLDAALEGYQRVYSLLQGLHGTQPSTLLASVQHSMGVRGGLDFVCACWPQHNH